jgi:hypothetical protein
MTREGGERRRRWAEKKAVDGDENMGTPTRKGCGGKLEVTDNAPVMRKRGWRVAGKRGYDEKIGDLANSVQSSIYLPAV